MGWKIEVTPQIGFFQRDQFSPRCFNFPAHAADIPPPLPLGEGWGGGKFRAFQPAADRANSPRPWGRICRLRPFMGALLNKCPGAVAYSVKSKDERLSRGFR